MIEFYRWFRCPHGIRAIEPLPRFKARQIALQKNRRGNPIDGSFAFLSTYIGGNQQIFSRLGRHPFVPENDGHRNTGLQAGRKHPHGLNRRTFTPVKPKRQTQQHQRNFVPLDQGNDVGNVLTERAPLKGFKRLCGPPQLIAQRDADPLRPIV